MANQNLTDAKNAKNNEFYTQFKNFFKKTLKTVFAISSYFSVVLYMTIPFLHDEIDNTRAQIVWFFSLFLNLIWIGVYLKNGRPSLFKNPKLDALADIGFVSWLLIFCSIFIDNYYTFHFFKLHRALCLIALILSPFYTYVTLKDYKQQRIVSSKETFRKSFLIINLYYWFFDLFLLSVFESFLLGEFIFGGTTMVFIFYTLAKMFLSGYHISNFFLLQYLLVGLGLSIYLIFIIPNSDLRDIVVIVISALYGGLFTLVGVAWTIKKGENVQREERRLLQKPYLFVRNQDEPSSFIREVSFFNECSKKNNVILVVGLKNTDNGIAILKYIKSSEHTYYAHYSTIIDKTHLFNILLKAEEDDSLDEVILVLEDVLGNQYSYLFVFDNYKKIIGLQEV